MEGLEVMPVAVSFGGRFLRLFWGFLFVCFGGFVVLFMGLLFSYGGL